jgi:hypothetical protein
VHKRISVVTWVEFISERLSYIILRGRWCHIIVLKIQAPTEDKIDDVKASFYKELDVCLINHMKMLLGDFTAKVGREDISKPTKVQCSHIATSINILRHLQMGEPTIRLAIFWQTGEGIRMYLMFGHSGQQNVILTTIWWWQKLGRD